MMEREMRSLRPCVNFRYYLKHLKQCAPDTHFNRTQGQTTYLTWGMYANQLRFWIDGFGRDKLLINRYEDMRDNDGRRQVLNDITDHLHVQRLEASDRMLSKQSNQYFVPEDEKIEMSAEMRQKLDEFFAPFNRDLYQLIGRNMQW